MSEDTPRQGSESNHSPNSASASAGGPGLSPEHRPASPSSVNSESARTPGEKQAISSGFGLPFLARVSKGRLNVSEASVPPPTSSDISASGEVFIPAHDHPSEWEGKKYHSSQSEKVETTNKNEQAEPGSEPLTQNNTAIQEGLDLSAHPKTPKDEPIPLPEDEREPDSQPRPNVFGEILERIPVIRIQRPSTPAITMASSLGTSAVSPAAGATAIKPADVLPLDPQSTVSVIPVGTLTGALPVPLPLPVPGLAARGKMKGKVKKLVGFARKHLLRKRLLAMVLGRPLANLVHPLLSQAGNLAGGLPLPVDGASDLRDFYTARGEKKRMTQEKQLAHRIADAKLRADAEEATRCQTCRGVTQSKYLRRYHRLLLKKNKPDMRMVDRHATAMARAVAFKCTCRRHYS